MNDSFCEDYVGEGAVLEDSSLALKTMSLVLLVLSPIIIVLCFIYFYINYKSYGYSETRNIFLLSNFALGLLVLAISISLEGYLGALNFSCRLVSLLSVAQVILILQPVWLRIFSLLWRINYNKLLISQTYLAFTKGTLKQKPGSIRFVQKQSGKHLKTEAYYSSVLETEGSFELLAPYSHSRNKLLHKYEMTKEKFFAIVLFDVLCIKSTETYPMNIRIAGVFASPKFASGLFVAIGLLTLVFSLGVEFYFLPFGTDCVNCVVTPTLTFIRVISSISALVIIYAIIKLYNAYDSFGIRKEIIVLGVSYIIILVAVYVVRFGVRTVDEDGTFNSFLLFVLHVDFAALYIFPYQIMVGQRLSKTSIGSSDDEDLLKKLLASDGGKKAFSLYLACSLSLENLFFYDAASKWKKSFASLEPDLQQTSADELFAQFLGEEGLLLINVSSACKEKIREELGNGLTANTFDEAIVTVWTHMATDIFPRFKKTAYYKASRNELQNV